MEPSTRWPFRAWTLEKQLLPELMLASWPAPPCGPVGSPGHEKALRPPGAGSQQISWNWWFPGDYAWGGLRRQRGLGPEAQSGPRAQMPSAGPAVWERPWWGSHGASHQMPGWCGLDCPQREHQGNTRLYLEGTTPELPCAWMTGGGGWSSGLPFTPVRCG